MPNERKPNFDTEFGDSFRKVQNNEITVDNAEAAANQLLLAMAESCVNHARQFTDKAMSRMMLNHQRVTQLVNSTVPTGELKSSINDDILRSAVVFTHAALEDALRTLAVELLPIGRTESLRGLRFGARRDGAKDAISVEELAKHRGKMVDDVIAAVVAEEFGKKSFNSVKDIIRLYAQLEIETTEAKPLFDDIAQLMDRRHMIVHQADIDNDSDGNTAGEIDAITVIKWQLAALKLAADAISGILKRISLQACEQGKAYFKECAASQSATHVAEILSSERNEDDLAGEGAAAGAPATSGVADDSDRPKAEFQSTPATPSGPELHPRPSDETLPESSRPSRPTLPGPPKLP